MEKNEEVGYFLEKVANEISITDTMIDKAESSYRAVGKWVGEGINYDVKIIPQGSIGLGTTIKPISDKDDYDIDLVCILLNGQYLNAKDIKNIVGNRLKEHKIYAEKIMMEGEGKRCWKMQYDEFHMDILPSVPLKLYIEPNSTNLRITHKENGIYTDRFSNPYGYRLWFQERMKDIINARKRAYALENHTSIEDVPIYRIKTPLQQAIQILKRHRDIYFNNKEKEFAPISIIITTLAARSYNGEVNLYNTIVNILSNMHYHIEQRRGLYWISNPVDSAENFADKWNSDPKRAEAFYKWLEIAKYDFISKAASCYGLDQLYKLFSNKLGDQPVNRAFKSIGNEMREKRENNKLYSAGLGGSLLSKDSGNLLVKGHTFFGK